MCGEALKRLAAVELSGSHGRSGENQTDINGGGIRNESPGCL